MQKIIIIILLCLASVTTFAQSDWQLKKEDDGISIYTRTVANSNFKSVKATCTVDATLPQLIAFLLDVEKQPQWVFNTRSAKILKRINENEIIFYAEVSAPWPVVNRDYVAHLVVKKQSPTLTTLDSHADSTIMPEKEGLVRVKKSVAHWDIITTSYSQLQIIYTLEFDPAGAIPAWLTNMFVTKGPMQTFEKMREGVKNPVYRDAHFDFLK